MQDNPENSLPPAAEETRLAPQLDLITALVLIALGLAVAVESWRMPRFEHLEANPYTIPGLVPGLLGVILAFLGTILLVRAGWLGGWRFESSTARLRDGLRKPEAAQLGLTLLLTVGYAAGLVGWIPFSLATFVFVTGFILLFEWRRGLAWRGRRGALRISAAIVQGIIVAVAVTLLFERVFLVRLP